MNAYHLMVYRVGVGKLIGLVFGVLGFCLLPFFIEDPSMTLRVAILLWYPTVGAVIGMAGLFARHPIAKFPLHWWLRGLVIGAWMNFVLVLFAYDQFSVLVIAIMGEYSAYASPYLMVIEGALLGMLTDYILTRLYGEGLENAIPG